MPRPLPIPGLMRIPMPRHMPPLSIGLANPGVPKPAQKPAPLPVIGPIPLGPVPSPNGISLTPFPYFLRYFFDRVLAYFGIQDSNLSAVPQHR